MPFCDVHSVCMYTSTRNGMWLPPCLSFCLTTVTATRIIEVQAGGPPRACRVGGCTHLCREASGEVLFFSPGSHEVPDVFLLLACLCLGTLSQFASLGHRHRGQAFHSRMAPAHLTGQGRQLICPEARKSFERDSCSCTNRPMVVTGLVRGSGSSFSAPLLRTGVSPTSFWLESATLPRHVLSLCQG